MDNPKLPRNSEDAYLLGVKDGTHAAYATMRDNLHEFRDNMLDAVVRDNKQLGLMAPSVYLAVSQLLDATLKLVDKAENAGSKAITSYEAMLKAAKIASEAVTNSEGSSRRTTRAAKTQETTRDASKQ